jgi:hypothetical protein
VLQTTAGKMIFCRWAEAVGEDTARGRLGDRREPRNGRDVRAFDRREAERRDERWLAAVGPAGAASSGGAGPALVPAEPPPLEPLPAADALPEAAAVPKREPGEGTAAKPEPV